MAETIQISTVGALGASIILQTTDGILYSVTRDKKTGVITGTPIRNLPRFPPGKQIEISDGLCLHILTAQGKVHIESIINPKKSERTTADQIKFRDNVAVERLSLINHPSPKMVAIDSQGMLWSWLTLSNRPDTISPMESKITQDNSAIKIHTFKSRDGFSLCRTMDGDVFVWGILAYKHLFPEFSQKFSEYSRLTSRECVEIESHAEFDNYLDRIGKLAETPFNLHQSYLGANPALRISFADFQENVFAFVVENDLEGFVELHHVIFSNTDTSATVEIATPSDPPIRTQLIDSTVPVDRFESEKPQQMEIGNKFVFLLNNQGIVTTVRVSSSPEQECVISDIHRALFESENAKERNIFRHTQIWKNNEIIPIMPISSLVRPQCSDNATMLAVSRDRMTLLHFDESAFNCEPYEMQISWKRT